VDRHAKNAFHGGTIEQGLEKHTALYSRRTLVVIVLTARKAAGFVIDNPQTPVFALLDQIHRAEELKAVCRLIGSGMLVGSR